MWYRRFDYGFSSFRHTDTPRSIRRIANLIRRLVSFVVSSFCHAFSSFRCGIRRFVMSFRRFVVSTTPLREAIIRRTLHEGLSIPTVFRALHVRLVQDGGVAWHQFGKRNK